MQGDVGIPEAVAGPDDWYRKAAVEFGPSLTRLAAAYEADPEHRQDLLQDIHLALWRSFAGFRAECSLRTWVYRVAHNTASSHALRQKRARLSQLVSVEALEAVPHEFDGERMVDASSVLEKLGTIVRQLKAIDRDVLLLYLEGLEPAEIAEVVGISPNHVAQKIHRTRKFLQRRFISGDKTDAHS